MITQHLENRLLQEWKKIQIQVKRMQTQVKKIIARMWVDKKTNHL